MSVEKPNSTDTNPIDCRTMTDAEYKNHEQNFLKKSKSDYLSRKAQRDTERQVSRSIGAKEDVERLLNRNNQ